MGQAWAKNLAAHSEVELAGWIDVREGAAASAAERHSLAFSYTGTDLDAAVAELKAKGVAFTMEPKEIRPGTKIAFITAPQNVSIELLQRA